MGLTHQKSAQWKKQEFILHHLIRVIRVKGKNSFCLVAVKSF
jgi:hypothetical protein